MAGESTLVDRLFLPPPVKKSHLRFFSLLPPRPRSTLPPPLPLLFASSSSPSIHADPIKPPLLLLFFPHLLPPFRMLPFPASSPTLSLSFPPSSSIQQQRRRPHKKEGRKKRGGGKGTPSDISFFSRRGCVAVTFSFPLLHPLLVVAAIP